jgi:hypothetical protein
MKILFTLIKFRNLYRVFKSFLSEISTTATVHSNDSLHLKVELPNKADVTHSRDLKNVPDLKLVLHVLKKNVSVNVLRQYRLQ